MVTVFPETLTLSAAPAGVAGITRAAKSAKAVVTTATFHFSITFPKQ
ncbi:MAG: hypothetical protein KDA95_02995 [Acidimicrobiales bacterium]|nr:hypothetical protein [Acidimicrobiales bacterium]